MSPDVGLDDKIPAIKHSTKEAVSPQLDCADADFHITTVDDNVDNPAPRPQEMSILDTVDKVIDATAMQLVNKAFSFISIDISTSPAPQDTINTSFPKGRTNESKTSGLFDKGFGAINGVGKFVEGFAVTLDNVIGQAFDEWGGTPKAPGREGKRKVTRPISIYDPSPSPSLTKSATPAISEAVTVTPRREVITTPKDNAAWQDFDVAEGEQEEESAHFSGFFSAKSIKSKEITIPLPGDPNTPLLGRKEQAKEIQQWRRRAQILQKELQKLRAQRDEYQKVKEEYEALLQELKDQKSGGGDATTSRAGDNHDLTPMDSLAVDQLMGQMQALLADKGRLAQENDRLLRENTGLHELLELFSVQQQQEQQQKQHQRWDGECQDDQCDLNAARKLGGVEQEDSYLSSGGSDDLDGDDVL